MSNDITEGSNRTIRDSPCSNRGGDGVQDIPNTISNSGDDEENKKKKKKKKPQRRKKKTNPKTAPTLTLNLLHFNPRGFINKEEVIKAFLDKHSISFAGFAETHTFHNAHISDKKWEWQAGSESSPGLGRHNPPGGIAFLVDRRLMSTIVHAGKYSVWSRIETDGCTPIFVAECYFPNSNESTKHKSAWDDIEDKVNEYRNLGHLLIMGDFNAHVGLDKSKIDTPGRLLLASLKTLSLNMVNGTPTCKGSTTRSEERANGDCIDTTIDYVFVSDSLLPFIESMNIEEDRLGSDHHPIIIKISNLTPSSREKTKVHRVWRVENIPHYKDVLQNQTFLNYFSVAFADWSLSFKMMVDNPLNPTTLFSEMADKGERSFQTCLDKVTSEQIGSKLVGPLAPNFMSASLRSLNDKRASTEKRLRRVLSNPISSVEDRALAIKNYRWSKAKAIQAGMIRKNNLDLKVFSDIEANRGDSKVFWNKAKPIRNGLRSSISPPPMAEYSQLGVTECETNPERTLEVWKKYWENLANPNVDEEAKYDNEHKESSLRRLEHLRNLPDAHPTFDLPFSRDEVWKAIRKLSSGKAAGVDGILNTIILAATGAIGNKKISQDNPMVDSMTLLFNFIFKHEVWPKRWGQGIIVPLFKDGSRLDPGNYRPISLLSVMGKIFGSIIENRLSDWSENSLVLADEQGGFRRRRGTPELIFSLREIILHRKALGQPTLTTFIDARKAYDSVWREGNYLHLHNLGIRGKMWRQLQAMNSKTESKIRLPFGETDWFRVTRGVAQGAVESPFLYSCFINGLAEDLRSKGLGIQAAGVLTPLLMYADDVVLLAATVDELRAMNQVATNYAFTNRYQFNGKKSNVMAFYADRPTMSQVLSEPWILFDEPVHVSSAYKYLGVDLTKNLYDWSTFINRIIATAIRTSSDLAWMCRQDTGLLPRSAAILWKSIVRPILEYAAELWAGDISKKLTKRAESVQTNFARAILGLIGCQSIPDDFIRAEMGMEKLTSRWEKLRLGYWRRLQMIPAGTTLHSLVALRSWQVEWAPRAFNNGWMGKTKDIMVSKGLGSHWANPRDCTKISKAEWKNLVYEAVEEKETVDTLDRLSCLNSNSVARFVRSKQWGKVDKCFASVPGEIDKRGALVVESYLDDRSEPIGRRLKLMCRAGCLPVLKRVVREANLPTIAGCCKMCNSGVIEDIEHFILYCEAYSVPRVKMMKTINVDFGDDSQEEILDVLLGKSTDIPHRDDCIDKAVKRFLKKSWRARSWLTVDTNMIFGRTDTPWAIHAHGDNLNASFIRSCKNAERKTAKKVPLPVLLDTL